ncbi:YlbF family regulator [Melghirimyces algeriensis]|uniref:Cell fate regulator YlbF, YheA/YmcA/DUF963 family (Controls sporulation, competence, biofilm development) n=1 Tax=Melghirimyces algeriensis TaxID=910412 RepID=A0A521CQZ6_9BACL|nr:YlbF family regulator [Melghirimyces algeriensis]SMO61889.1 Cell fate regulator YlbF, YheA/YmcA/DUF963 family (controls sporulation, competence, biofilm development) [Melghirimyces algeriensis]
MKSLDMTELLLETYKLADQIKESKEVKRYLDLKREIHDDQEAQRLIKEFQRKKEMFEECQRFGHFHPEYHKAKQEAEDWLTKMKGNPKIREYMELEERLDFILGEVSRTIARTVSSSIKVPVNDSKELKMPNRNRRKSH